MVPSVEAAPTLAHKITIYLLSCEHSRFLGLYFRGTYAEPTFQELDAHSGPVD
jgi:hypothetical protein